MPTWFPAAPARTPIIKPTLIRDFQFAPAAVREEVGPSTIHPTMERTTYSYLILSSLQITKCSRIQPTSMHRTYMVIMNAEPMNCCKSTAKPMVDRKVREMNRPRSRLPRSFCTGLICANAKTDGQQPCNITDRPFFIGHQRLFIALFQLFFAELVRPELVPFFGCLHQHWSCKQEYHQWGGNNIVCCICSCQCFSRTIQTGCNSSQV